jgi:IS5 family transposase
MAERTNADLGLVDAWTANLGGPRTAALLARLDKAVAWAVLVKPIAALPEYRGPARGEANPGGRPAWPALTMLKCVLLAKWFGLSDPQLEECLQDRLSFRRFVGLSLADATPDETTFVRFRARLREAGLDRVIFERTTAELDRRGLLVRDGTLVDATIIEQSRGHRRDDGTSTRDPEASFTQKGGETYHGCKGHIAADRGGIVKDSRFSDAAPHDSNFIDELTRDEKKMVVADSAYRSQKRGGGDGPGRVLRHRVQAAEGTEGPAADAQAAQPIDRVGAGGGGAPVRVDAEHGVPARALPRATPRRTGLRPDPDRV